MRRRSVLQALGAVIGGSLTGGARAATLSGCQDAPSGPSSGHGRSQRQDTSETTMATALTWWSELPNKWTPAGWKDHLFRFNVLFNGTLIAQPDLSRRTTKWKGQGLQLSFLPSPLGTFGVGSLISEFPRYDDGRVIQGWNNGPSPVLHSDWAEDGLLLRQEVFAHVPGGQPIQTGIEPLFAWVRLSVTGFVQGLPLEKEYGFALKLNAPHLGHGEEIRNNLYYDLERARYPRELSPDGEAYSSAKGYRLFEPDKRVRLGFPAGQQCFIRYEVGQPTEHDLLLHLGLAAEIGTHVDLLVPMLPTDEHVFDQELSLGYELALEEANNYWSHRPDSRAIIRTPEPFINEAFEHEVQIVEITTERDPATGYHSILTGSWVYAGLWATPVTITMVFLLDNLGYHEMVEKYLQLFRLTQGSVVPPGAIFASRPHDGYLATPSPLTEVNWLSDHGCVLWTIANHALVSGSKRFEDEWTPVIVRACEFIKAARRIELPGAVPGVMPPAVQNDYMTEIQGTWNDGWNYKGLATAVRYLKRIRHPRADEFAAEANAYKAAFAKAIREKTREMPSWKDDRGASHQLVPPCLYGDTAAEMRRSETYLDTGPLFLVFSGLLNAEDELMRSTLLWFREGPPTKIYRYDSNCFQVGSLWHEMSSAEPCYSWNLFHSYALGDRSQFLEGMYSLFAGALSRQTYEMCETRGGISSVAPCLPSFYLARLAVIDDQLVPDELHLLRLVPLAWLEKEGLSFDKIPTEFGPVSLKATVSSDKSELRVTYSSRFRLAPARVTVHIPPVGGLKKIVLNGLALNWDRKQPAIELT